MSMLKRLWTQIVRFVKALEGIDDPAGDYMFFSRKARRRDRTRRGASRKSTAFAPWRQRDPAVSG
jgi:hypothetical protein